MDNRSAILACALKLFAARGYDAVGIQEIVDTVGITKPTLYHYFGSKQGLLETLLEQHFSELHTSVRQAARYEHDLPLTLNRVAGAYFDYADRHRSFYRLQLGMWFAPLDSIPYKVVSRLNVSQQQILEDLFHQAVQDHGNMRDREKAYASTFLGMINTYISLALNEALELNDSLVFTAVHQFMHGIYS